MHCRRLIGIDREVTPAILPTSSKTLYFEPVPDQMISGTMELTRARFLLGSGEVRSDVRIISLGDVWIPAGTMTVRV